jgi:hypothetical protein
MKRRRRLGKDTNPRDQQLPREASLEAAFAIVKMLYRQNSALSI